MYIYAARPFVLGELFTTVQLLQGGVLSPLTIFLPEPLCVCVCVCAVHLGTYGHNFSVFH